MNQAVHTASQQAGDPSSRGGDMASGLAFKPHVLTSSPGDYGQATLPLWVSDVHL